MHSAKEIERQLCEIKIKLLVLTLKQYAKAIFMLIFFFFFYENVIFYQIDKNIIIYKVLLPIFVLENS